MKKLHLLVLSFSFTTLIFAQNEASFWYFGNNAGLQFDTATGSVIAVTDGQLSTLEGCSTISDADGNLLFYSDGSTVWNSAHQVMENGTGLKGDDSSTSSGLIVPKPFDPSTYYIFTVDEPHHNNSANFPNQSANDGINDGLTYSVVDITANGGLGAVDNSQKNIPLITYNPTSQVEDQYRCSEKITAVRAEDCSSIWIVTHFLDTFYAFKVDTNGVTNTPVTSTVGPLVPLEGYRRNAIGYLKASPDGSKLITANSNMGTNPGGSGPGNVVLFDFNNDTGEVTNPEEIYNTSNGGSPYGVEFSAETTKAYATITNGGSSQLVQWDLLSQDITNSFQIIHTSSRFSGGALQLGVDKKIYRALLDFDEFSSSRFLGVINNPEANSVQGVNYDEQGILLDINNNGQNLSRIGLPPFIQSLFNSEIDIIKNGESTSNLNLCDSETYTLEAEDLPGADYVWTRNGNLLSETSFQLLVSTDGVYEVTIEPNNGECPIIGKATVSYFDLPVITTPQDITACNNNGSANTATFDFSTLNDAILAPNATPSDFVVSYHINSDDAINNVNNISFPFENTSNPQTIFFRVSNIDNPDCAETSSFEINVSNAPTAENITDLEVCDTFNDLNDGIAQIDLNDFTTQIIGDQNNVNTTYHLNSDDAENNTNALSSPFTNTTLTTEIFVRLENALNTNCFTVSSFDIIINPVPQAINTTLLQCDDDGINEGFTTFNLNEAIDAITNSANNVTVSFFETIADAENNTNALNTNVYQNFINPDVIYARVTSTITGCFSTAEITLQASVTSTFNTTLSQCDDDGLQDGFYTFNLNDAADTVLANSPAGLTISYYDTYTDALLETNAISNTYTNTTPYQQTVFARVENGNVCYGISQIQLNVFQQPQLNENQNITYCLNLFPETIGLSAQILNNTSNAFSYLWSTGATTSAIQVNAAGVYNVTVTNSLGCSSVQSFTVTASNIATIENINITDAVDANSISVIVSGEGLYEFALNAPNGPYQSSHTFTNVLPGFYTVYIRDVNNCGITNQDVAVIGFPKFFTPNGDGVNEFWNVRGINAVFQPNTTVLIFDKQGKLLIELDPLGSGWNGTINGLKMPSSDYWFKVTLQDGRVYTDHFALKR